MLKSKDGALSVSVRCVVLGACFEFLFCRRSGAIGCARRSLEQNYCKRRFLLDCISCCGHLVFATDGVSFLFFRHFQEFDSLNLVALRSSVWDALSAKLRRIFWVFLQFFVFDRQLCYQSCFSHCFVLLAFSGI